MLPLLEAHGPRAACRLVGECVWRLSALGVQANGRAGKLGALLA